MSLTSPRCHTLHHCDIFFQMAPILATVIFDEAVPSDKRALLSSVYLV